jgi:hypothetical protein
MTLAVVVHAESRATRWKWVFGLVVPRITYRLAQLDRMEEES